MTASKQLPQDAATDHRRPGWRETASVALRQVVMLAIIVAVLGMAAEGLRLYRESVRTNQVLAKIAVEQHQMLLLRAVAADERLARLLKDKSRSEDVVRALSDALQNVSPEASTAAAPTPTAAGTATVATGPAETH